MTYHHHTGSSSSPAIVTRGLTRHFTSRKQTVEAVQGLDLEIGQGELVAFLGPNGAGKSTTLRMLTTLIPPTSGSAEVAGHDVVTAQRDVRQAIGFVGQGNGAGHRQLGRDELVSQGRAHGLSRADAHRRAGELIEDLDLGAVADRKVSTLSGGQRRRLDIAMGLVHLPRVLFLDEPSTGLDPQNRANLQELVRRLHAESGSTVVLTTHYLEEADALAGRVIVVDHGRMIADDSAARLKSRLGDLVRLGFGTSAEAGRAAARLERVPDSRVDVDGDTVSLRVKDGSTMVGELLADLAADGVPPTRVEVARPTLDDVFLDLTGRSLRETQQTDQTTTEADAASAQTRERGRSMSTFVSDTVNVMNRELKPVWREPMAVVFAMIQPLVFLGLFAPLLPEMATGGSALQWFVPGIVAMTALMGASFTGSSLMEEMQSGSHERQLVSPLGRPALLVGRALKEVVPMLMQVVIIVAVVTPFSFDLHLGGVVAAALVLSLFSVGVGALSFALALASKGQDWMFWTVQQTLLFPALLTAGVLLPMEGAPRWLEVVSMLNPMTYVVDATRALFAGTYPADVVAQGVAGAAVVAALGLVVGVRAMRRSS